MIELSDIFHQYGKEYIAQFGQSMPQEHLKALCDIADCRTENMGGQIYKCPDCGDFHYSYFSCGNRNCNKCQQDKAEKWFEHNKERLLPVPHFLLTFTLPDKLRMIARSNQRLFYNLLFRTSSQTLQELAYDPDYVGGLLGMIGILHTWSRDLNYHPHVHYIVPGGGLFVDANLWLEAQPKFLVPVKALSKIFRAKFRDALQKEDPHLFESINQEIWRQEWVVHAQFAGNGKNALRYLTRYVFKVAISNSRILKLENGQVTFKYQNSNTREWKIITLNVVEFMRRFLQHVLPKGLVKVRCYGFYAVKNKHLLQRIKTMFNMYVIDKQPDPKNDTPPVVKALPCCPKCGKAMILVNDISKKSFTNRAPPEIKALLNIKFTMMIPLV